MNTVALVGNLCSEVELRHTNSGKDVANFRLAVDRPGKDAGADFITVSTWNGSAKACAEYLVKGSRVAVTGSIRTRSWEQDGAKRYAVEVSANRVEFLTPKFGSSPEVAETATPAPADDDIPF